MGNSTTEGIAVASGRESSAVRSATAFVAVGAANLVRKWAASITNGHAPFPDKRSFMFWGRSRSGVAGRCARGSRRFTAFRFEPSKRQNAKTPARTNQSRRGTRVPARSACRVEEVEAEEGGGRPKLAGGAANLVRKCAASITNGHAPFPDKPSLYFWGAHDPVSPLAARVVPADS